MTCNIVHRTTYGYSAPVTVSQHAARVEPRSLRNQFLEEFSLRIEPEPSVRKTRTDYFGNRICFFSIQEVHSRLEIVAECRVTVAPVTQPVLSLSPRWEQVARLFSDPVSPEVVEPYEFVFDSPLLRASPALADYARQSFSAESPLLTSVLDFNRRIHADFKYDKIATTVATPLKCPGLDAPSNRSLSPSTSTIVTAPLRGSSSGVRTRTRELSAMSARAHRSRTSRRRASLRALPIAR